MNPNSPSRRKRMLSSSSLMPPDFTPAGGVSIMDSTRYLSFAGRLLMIAGYQARLVATALALFCLVTAFSFHSNFADQNQMFHFLKNVMMAGGLLQIVAFGAGVISVDSRLSRGRGTVASAVPAHG